MESRIDYFGLVWFLVLFGLILVLNILRQESDVQQHDGVTPFYNLNSVCYIGDLLIAASSILGGYYSAPIFLQFKEFELYWGAVFFLKICSHIFMIFEVKLEY